MKRKPDFELGGKENFLTSNGSLNASSGDCSELEEALIKNPEKDDVASQEAQIQDSSSSSSSPFSQTVALSAMTNKKVYNFVIPDKLTSLGFQHSNITCMSSSIRSSFTDAKKAKAIDGLMDVLTCNKYYPTIQAYIKIGFKPSDISGMLVSRISGTHMSTTNASLDGLAAALPSILKIMEYGMTKETLHLLIKKKPSDSKIILDHFLRNYECSLPIKTDKKIKLSNEDSAASSASASAAEVENSDSSTQPISNDELAAILVSLSGVPSEVND